MKKELTIDGHGLSIQDVYEVASKSPDDLIIKLSEMAEKNIIKSDQYVNKILESDNPIYGINTGFGALATTHIQKKDLAQLQLNLIRSHCTGLGEPFGPEVTRAIMLLRINCLSSGFSGISIECIQMLLNFLNHDILPIIPKKGSVGASGDLAPLSHMSLALIGEGEVIYKGEHCSSSFAIKDCGYNPVKLGPKDGLALINGTTVMTALGALAIYKAEILMKTADICAAITLDGVSGTTAAYDYKIHALKPHPGQLKSAININNIIKDSEILKSHLHCKRVQDPYSLRCVPQVHGASRQALAHAKEVITIELNAVTDNPLLFENENEVISGGNFHGEAVAIVMDYLAIGASELCNISERRIEKMMNPTFSSLPSFLTMESGLNSGLMIAHVTAAALASENKYLCHPASIDSIPTSTDKEDHVSMGVTAGRKLHEILDNLSKCLAIELLCNTQAIEFHHPKKSSEAIEALIKYIRRGVPPIKNDRPFYKDINYLESLVNQGEILDLVENFCGKLK